MVRRFSGVRRVAVAAVIAIAGTASIAPAQDFGGGRGFGGGGGMMTAGINSRDLEHYQDMLNLTKDQRETVKALFEGYQEQSRTRAQEIRDKMQDMREQMRDGGDAAARRGFGQMMVEFRQQRQKMDDAFFGDVQAVLNEQQKAVWPKVERSRRREQSINRDLMSGERADVIKIIDSENLPAEVKAKVQPVLDQYEIELDRELTVRTKIFDENMTKVMDLMGQGDPAQMAEKFEPMLKQAREAAVRVRDVNRRYARQVEDLLPDDKKGVFQQAFKQASFPNIYRQSQSDRQIVAAQGFADLTDEQKTAIAALKEAHAHDEAAAQEKLAVATEENEMKMTADQVLRRLGGGFMMGGRGQGGAGGGGQGGGQNGGRGGNNAAGGNNQGGRGNQAGGRGGPPQEAGPLADMRESFRELDKSASESLKKILKPEQVDRLPQQDDRAPGGGGDNQPQRRRGGQNNRT